MRKKEVYFFYAPPPSLDEVVVDSLAYRDWIKDLLPNIQFPINFNLEKFLDIFTIEEAWADTVPPPTCTTGTFYPAGTCAPYYFVDDDPSDGRQPGMTLCFKYNVYGCHADGMWSHMINSLYWTRNHPNGATAVTDCMKVHNGEGFLKYPVNLTINVWKHWTDFCPGCTRPLCGSAPIGDFNASPKRSVDKLVQIMSELPCQGCAPCERNSWETNRHEVLHTYGYQHTTSQPHMGTGNDRQTNTHNSAHCRLDHRYY